VIRVLSGVGRAGEHEHAVLLSAVAAHECFVGLTALFHVR